MNRELVALKLTHPNNQIHSEKKFLTQFLPFLAQKFKDIFSEFSNTFFVTFMSGWSRSLRSLAPAKIVPICPKTRESSFSNEETRVKVFFPCQCCRSSSSWWCRPCFGGLECWRWWWFDPPRRQAGPFVAWPYPRGGVPPFLPAAAAHSGSKWLKSSKNKFTCSDLTNLPSKFHQIYINSDSKWKAQSNKLAI